MTVINWLTGLPVVLLFPVMIAFWLAVGLAMWWLVERFADHERLTQGRDSLGRVLTIVASFYVFLLGFIIYEEWNNFTAARTNVSVASAALTTAGLNTTSLPKRSADELGTGIQDFGRSIVCQDFPSLKASAAPATATGKTLESLFNTVAAQPAAVRETAIYSDLTSELETASNARREWITTAEAGIPKVIVVIIFIVSAFVLGLFVLQRAGRTRPHLLALVALAVFMGLGTGLVMSLYRPFASAAKISPESFAQGLDPTVQDCSLVKKQGSGK